MKFSKIRKKLAAGSPRTDEELTPRHVRVPDDETPVQASDAEPSLEEPAPVEPAAVVEPPAPAVGSGEAEGAVEEPETEGSSQVDEDLDALVAEMMSEAASAVEEEAGTPDALEVKTSPPPDETEAALDISDLEGDVAEALPSEETVAETLPPGEVAESADAAEEVTAAEPAAPVEPEPAAAEEGTEPEPEGPQAPGTEPATIDADEAVPTEEPGGSDEDIEKLMAKILTDEQASAEAGEAAETVEPALEASDEAAPAAIPAASVPAEEPSGKDEAPLEADMPSPEDIEDEPTQHGLAAAQAAPPPDGAERDGELADIEDLIRQSLGEESDSAPAEDARQEPDQPVEEVEEPAAPAEDVGRAEEVPKAESVAEAEGDAEVEKFLHDVLDDNDSDSPDAPAGESGAAGSAVEDVLEEYREADKNEEEEEDSGVLDEEMEQLLAELLEVEEIPPSDTSETEQPQQESSDSAASQEEVEQDIRSQVAAESRKIEKELDKTSPQTEPARQETQAERVEIDAPEIEPELPRAGETTPPPQQGIMKMLNQVVDALNYPLQLVPQRHRQTFNMAVAFLATATALGAVVILVLGFLM